MKTVLVTGAAGTVGNYVVGLAEAAGLRVVASDRTSAGLRQPVRGEIRAGDLCDPAFVERVVAGVDYVIHTAALLDVFASASDLTRINTDAVALLYEAATRAKVKRFIHTSTAMLYGVHHGGPLTEDAPLAPRGPFGMSKHGAEIFLRAATSGNGPSWTIVRSAPVYGRRGKHFAAGLLAVGPILRLGTPFVPRFEGGPVATLAHAEDVARSLLFLLEREDAGGEIFNVADDDPLPLGERIAETYRAYGIPSFSTGKLSVEWLDRLARVAHTPGSYEGIDVGLLASWRLVILRHRLKPALRPRLDRETLTLLGDDLVVDASKLRALGWQPRFGRFSQGWREVLKWYQAERWVPRYA